MLLRTSWLSLVVVVVLGGCSYKAHKSASGWLVVDTEHIRLRTNVSRARATQLAFELQHIRDVLAGHALRCASRGGADRLPVTVLPPSEYDDIARKGVAAFFRRSAAGWLPDYQAHIVLPDDLDPKSRQVFQHELTHYLVDSCLPAAPKWLSEGLASFLETAVLDAGELTFGAPPYLILNLPIEPKAGYSRSIVVTVMPLRMVPPLHRLFAASPGQWMSHDSLANVGRYAAAWALVHLLEIGDPDLHGRFQAFLGELHQLGGNPDALFARAFDGVQLQARLNEYLRRGKYRLFATRVGPPRKSVARVRAMSDSEGHVHRAWLWSLPGGARQPMHEHLAAARKDPTTRVRAHLLAALILVDDNDLPAAEREVAAALREAPRDAALLYAYLALLLEREAPLVDILAAADRLRPVARTPDQVCTLGRVELGRGNPKGALEHAVRGLRRKPSSSLCRSVHDGARQATAG